MFANLGSTLDGKSGNQAAVFASAFIGSLDKCGTQTKAFVQKPGLSLSLIDSSKDDIAQTIQQLEPDSILDISWRTQWSNTRGLSKTVYALQLRNVKSKAIVWKAEVDLTQGWYKAEALAGTIIGRLKQDTLISPACVAPEPESPLLHRDKV